jgi:small subunit ribosomal protein S21
VDLVGADTGDMGGGQPGPFCLLGRLISARDFARSEHPAVADGQWLCEKWNLDGKKGGEIVVTSVELRPGESQESLLRRFRKKVTKARILSTVKRKRHFVSKSEQRRRARLKAIRRERKRQYRRKRRYRR